jgi:hypothetical protein
VTSERTPAVPATTIRLALIEHRRTARREAAYRDSLAARNRLLRELAAQGWSAGRIAKALSGPEAPISESGVRQALAKTPDCRELVEPGGV